MELGQEAGGGGWGGGGGKASTYSSSRQINFTLGPQVHRGHRGGVVPWEKLLGVLLLCLWPEEGGSQLENNPARQRGEVDSKEASKLREAVAQKEGKSEKNKELESGIRKLKPKGPLEEKKRGG